MSTAPSVAVGTPSGSWRPPARTGASSGSTPTPPRSRGWGSGSPGSATGSSCGRRTSGRSARWPRTAGFGAVDGILLDLGLSSFQLADAGRGFGFRAGGPLDMRFDPTARRARLRRCSRASTRRPWSTSSGATARSRMRDGSRGPSSTRRRDRADRDRRAAGRRSWSGPCPAARARAAASIPPRASSRRSGSRSTASSTPSRPPSRRRSTLLRPGGRLVVLSYHSLEDRIVKRFVAAERRGCTCPPSFPVCVCGRAPRLRPVGPQPAMPDGGRGRRQSPCPERPAPDRRAARRMSRARRREGGHRR